MPGTDCREHGNSGAWYYILSRQGAWETVNAYLNVYHTPIDDILFDHSYRLANPEREVMMTYYKADLSANISTAADIREDGIPLALLPN